MARRSGNGDISALVQELQSILKSFADSQSKNNDIKGKVLTLVNANYILRDIGSSLVSQGKKLSARERILAYLRLKVGETVSGDQLMVVSGISEYARRIRELRVEHGWQIISGNTVKDMRNDDEDKDAQKLPDLKPDEYILLSSSQDKDAAARWRVAKTIRNDKNLSVRDKIIEYFKKNVGKPISGEELKYLAKDKSEWARRVRELRTEFGWSIVTKATGRPDLPVGVYILEDLRQAPEHDRKIKDDVRVQVLKRDEYKCQDCGWSRKDWTPDDARHLELHHVLMHSKGGANDEENLVTLCNICHDVRHRKQKPN